MRKTLFLSPLLVFMLSGCSDKEETKQMETQHVTAVTYAGTKALGYNDHNKEKAQFFVPTSIDEHQNVIYVADTNNHVIRKIDNKKVTTVAGSFSKKDDLGKPIGGYRDGDVSIALFNHPTDVTVIEDGTVYVTDSNNGAIRRITTSGKVETVVKNLKYPSHLVVDREGTLYITEKLAHRIVKITKDKKVAVIAGGGYKIENNWTLGSFKDGVGEQAQFNEPTGIALSKDGYLLVSDTGNQRIRKVEMDGTVTTIAGGGKDFITNSNYIVGDFKDGTGEEARFNFPQGIEYTEDESLVITDTLNHRIRMLHPDGRISTLAGNKVAGLKNGVDNQIAFDNPSDVVVTPKGMYIADSYNHTIRFVTITEKNEGNNK